MSESVDRTNELCEAIRNCRPGVYDDLERLKKLVCSIKGHDYLIPRHGYPCTSYYEKRSCVHCSALEEKSPPPRPHKYVLYLDAKQPVFSCVLCEVCKRDFEGGRTMLANLCMEKNTVVLDKIREWCKEHSVPIKEMEERYK